jgi:integral membrane protein
MKNIFSLFRKIAFAEGISFLVLLFIAMPLKYLAHIDKAVKIVGSLHGFLFVAFVLLAAIVLLKYKKSIWWFAKAIIASFIPFGTFYMDKEWKGEEGEIIN